VFVQQSTKSYSKNEGETIYWIWAKNCLQYLCLPSISTVGTPEIVGYWHYPGIPSLLFMALCFHLINSIKTHSKTLQFWFL
jgi:hypothetical protein